MALPLLQKNNFHPQRIKYFAIACLCLLSLLTSYATIQVAHAENSLEPYTHEDKSIDAPIGATSDSKPLKPPYFKRLFKRIFSRKSQPDICEIDHNDANLLVNPKLDNALIALDHLGFIDNSQPFYQANGEFVRYHPLGNIALTPRQRPLYQDQNTRPIWPLLRSQFQLDLDIKQKRLAQQLNWYKRHPKYLSRVLTRSTPYFHFVLSEIKKRNLPGELALLPIVESAYDPFAYSHGRASGMWQFIPGTGKAYGLKQNWWYDGRRDIAASTRAALDYLESLNKRFDGDWLHALAAYNSGGGTVNRAIRKNREKGLPTDFWSLKLPKETQAYVPKLLALSKIFAAPRQYDIALTHIPDTPQFATIELDSQIDMAQAASLADMSLAEIYRFNPGFNRWATDPEGPHKLLIPIGKSVAFQKKLKALPPEQKLTWRRYKIKNGDSLGLIAQRHHTTVRFLKDVNQLRSNRVIIGKILLIPSPSQSLKAYKLSATQRQLALQRRQPANTQKFVHRVKSGESFWTIARKYKVKTRQVAKWNGMAPKDTLRIGQKLTIWSKHRSLASAKTGPQVVRKINYRVRNGDSLARIAGKFNVSIAQLTQWNNLDRRRYLQPGQPLKLWVDITNVSI
ncbi:MAG: LysM peptidoglycan-binding domain-containing protein [Pseudomonadales bacterium]|nr:LysM peptidoglycan-binding domain-containing protein [Pseudomonadales bacterium]